jgi:hypothetical protein
MRPSTAVWPLITVLVWGSIAQARELPSQVDLRAAYCVAVLKDRHSEFAGDLGSFMTAEVKAAVEGFPIGTEQF